MEWIRVRGFGEVFVALDKSSNDLVAIKRVKMVMEDDQIASESKLLKECQSRYIVRYYDVMRREGELWVRMVRMNDELDCDGILPLWVCGSVFEEWESIEGGGVERGGELLFAGVVVPTQEECDSKSDDWYGE